METKQYTGPAFVGTNLILVNQTGHFSGEPHYGFTGYRQEGEKRIFHCGWVPCWMVQPVPGKFIKREVGSDSSWEEHAERVEFAIGTAAMARLIEGREVKAGLYVWEYENPTATAMKSLAKAVSKPGK